jgi:hypothetical protein
MEYNLSITHQHDYLHVKVSGRGSYNNALAMWREVVRNCELHQCYRILGEQHIDVTLSTAEALDYPALFKAAGITTKHRIAWVDTNPRTRETTAFIRDILANRATGNGRLFHSLEPAKGWLLKNL